ncbi:MAG: AsmA family protein [Pseudomonadota bacterium]
MLWLTRIFLVLASLLALAFASLFVVPLFWDWSQYREQFEAQASELVGMPVRVTGDTAIRILPTPKVRFTDIEIGKQTGDGGGALSGTVAGFEMDMELAPLATGEVRIFDMKVIEPDLRMSLAEDMRFEFPAEVADDAGGASTRVVFENVELTGGSFALNDLASGRSFTLTDMNAVLNARSIRGPWRAEGTSRVEIKTGVEGRPPFTESFAFDLGTGSVQDDGGFRTRLNVLPESQPIELELQGDTLVEDGLPSLDGIFKISQALEDGSQRQPATGFFDWWEADGQFALALDAISSNDFELRLADPEDPYKISGTAELDFAEAGGFEVDAVGEQVDLKRFANFLPGATAVTLPERLFAFRSFIRSLPPISRSGSVSLSLPAMVIGGAAVRDLQLEARPGGEAWNIARFEATIPGRTKIRAAGRLNTDTDFGFAGSLIVASNQPSGLAALFTEDIHPAIRSLARAGLAAEVDLTPESQRFADMELDLDGALLTGTLSHSFPKPGEDARVLDVTLGGGVLDLDAVNALSALMNATDDNADALNLRADIDLDGLQAGTLQTGAIAGVLSIQSRDGTGEVDIESINIESVAGLDVSASGRVDAARQIYDLIVRSQGETLSSAVDLLTTRFAAARPLVQHLIDRPALTQGSDLTLRLVTTDDTLSVRADGKSGGTSGSFSIQGPADMTARTWRDAELRISTRLTQPRPSRLMAQFNVPVPGLSFEDTLRMDVDLSGSLAAGLRGATIVRSNEDRLSAEGVVSLPSNYDPEKRLAAQARFDQEVQASVGDAARWSALFGRVIPNLFDGLPASLEGRVVLADGRADLRDAKGVVDGTGWTGDLVLETRGRRPGIGGDLLVQSLSLEAVSEWTLGQGTLPSSFVTRQTEPLGPNTLDGLDADIRLAANSVSTGFGVSLSGLRAGLRISDGAVSFTNAEAQLGQATVSGDLSISPGAEAAAIQAQGNISGASLSEIAPWASALESMADIGFDLQGTGASPAEIVSQLAGGGTLALKGLTISDLGSDILTGVVAISDEQDAALETGELEALVAERLRGGAMEVPEVIVPFSIAGGQVRANAVRLESEQGVLALNAALDLGAGALSIDGTMELNAGSEAVAGAQPEIGISYSGPIVAPERSINVGALGSYLTLRSFEREQRRVELLQVRILERQRLRREVRYYETARLADEAEAAQEARLKREAEAQRLAQEAARAAATPAPDETVETLPDPAPNRAPVQATELQPLPSLDLDPILDTAPASDGELPPLENFDVQTLPGLFTNRAAQSPGFAN